MDIEIKVRKFSESVFDEIDEGTVFMIPGDECLFMKIEKIGGINNIRIATGATHRCDADQQVILIKGKYVYE